MKNILRKLTSRKFWLALAGVVTGVATIFGVEGGDVSTVAGLVTVVVSSISFIFVEGKVDWESIRQIVENTKEVVEVFTDEDN